MKKLVNKTKGLVRGTSTAVLLSVAIHAVLFFGAGVWVVFKFIDAKEAKFVPQKIDRPKMKLKKLRVKVKEQAKPRKTTQRIASSRKSADLPDIQLPEMTGMGAGLEGAIAGFDMMADLSSMTLFGGQRSLGNDLEGTFYHLKRDRQGDPISGYTTGDPVSPQFVRAVNEFVASDWDTSTLDEFYRAPTKLYATHFTFGVFPSSRALEKYNMGDDVEAAMYIIHYKGKIAHPTGGKFRFLGTADDFLFVRINGKMVLDGRTTHGGVYQRWNSDLKTGWYSNDPEDRKYPLADSTAKIGDWFVLEPGVPAEMEVLIGEDWGGGTSCMINVEEFGKEYPENELGWPIFPAFKTAPLPEHIVDELNYHLFVGDTDLKSDLIFSAY